MAESAVSLVIENLVPLLVQEARLLEGIHDKVESIKGELEFIQSFLRDADVRAEKVDMSNVEKIWVKQIREEAYHIEDVIDEYILHCTKGPYGQRQRFHFLLKIFQFTIKLKAGHVIASRIQDINRNLQEKREIAIRYHFNTIEQGGLSSDARSVAWLDPRVASLFIEEAEVVGIESHKDKLINWLIASRIQDINRNLQEKREIAIRYHFNTIEQGGLSSDARSVAWLDPRVASLFIEEAEVVGIESHKDKLINWLVEGPSNRTVISVVGIGGVGKTTLVKKVYDNEKVVAQFDCRAWITVSKSYKMEELFRDMIKQFYEARNEFAPKEIDTMEEIKLIKVLRQYLDEQRYVVVFDDVWDTNFWEHIKLALPNNRKGSGIVITTRNENVAPPHIESSSYYVHKQQPLPSEKAWELFCKKVFQLEGGNCPLELVEPSHNIVERCEGLPLAIVAIGGLLSTKDKVVSEWNKWPCSLSFESETNSRLRSISKILSLSYHDLPYNLKACFLYFGMFPEAYSINCARLIRLWIAEGFVKEKQGKILEDVAQDYLNQLIYRSLVQVEWVDYDGCVRTCRVHDMIREVIVSRSEELSCCHVSIRDCSSFDGIGRRLSIHNNLDTPLERTTSSKTRSIIVSRADEMPNSFLTACFENFKLMKVMDFECAPITYIPKEVGNLFHLRYLSLRGTKVQMLPKSINKLHNLETLDLKRSLVSELPTEISGLCKLRYLAAYIQNDDIEYHINFRKAIKVPSGIGDLESLHKLYNVEACSNAFIAELGKLRLLRKLEITKLKRENGKTLCIALKKMSDLRSLRICATSEEEILELQSMSSPPPFLHCLILVGRLEKLPEWISNLKNIVTIALYWSRLANDPLKVLQALPNLMNLRFRDGYEGEQLHFEGGGFQKLKYLMLEKLGGLNRLKIDDGALPLLEKLRIGHSPHLKEVPSGVHHLKGLKNLECYEMPREFVLSMQLDGGPNFWKVKHVHSISFWYRIQGEKYKTYKLGDPELLDLLRS